MRAIVFDTETTGIDEPALVQSGWVEVNHMGEAKGKPCGQLWNPGKPIGYGAMATHHILDEDVRDAQPARDFALPDGVTHLIGHNIDFDWRVIGQPDIKRICTLALARRMWPDQDSHTLGALLYRVMGPVARSELANAHDAAADVGFCVRVLRAICVARQPADLDDLWRMSEDARVPGEFLFGKHKGRRIADVRHTDPSYITWLLKQQFVQDDPYLMKALQS